MCRLVLFLLRTLLLQDLEICCPYANDGLLAYGQPLYEVLATWKRIGTKVY